MKEIIYEFIAFSMSGGSPLFYRGSRTLRRRAAARSRKRIRRPCPLLVLPGFTRICRPVHVHVHNRVAKELCGAQGPTGRSPVEFLPIEGYRGELGTHATLCIPLLSALSLYVRRLPRPPPCSLFVTPSSRS